MAIPLDQKFRLAAGSEGDFSDRVLVQLHRRATYALDGNPTGQEAAAARAVWQNVSNYRFPVSLAVLNGPLLNEEDAESIDDADIDSGVGGIWERFVEVYFPE
jgi:hypothetical protein